MKTVITAAGGVFGRDGRCFCVVPTFQYLHDLGWHTLEESGAWPNLGNPHISTLSG